MDAKGTVLMYRPSFNLLPIHDAFRQLTLWLEPQMPTKFSTTTRRFQMPNWSQWPCCNASIQQCISAIGGAF